MIQHQLLLADDDTDDCVFFQEVLTELPVLTSLDTVNDGVELMDYLLKNSETLPDLLFLDLNMPRKTGFECLIEIKANDALKHLPVIILSTSLDMKVVDSLYDMGAQYYNRKPGQFNMLNKVIQQAIMVTDPENSIQPKREDFILQT